jgi:hypothetical protein
MSITPNFPNYTITPMSPITHQYTSALYCVHASMRPFDHLTI